MKEGGSKSWFKKMDIFFKMDEDLLADPTVHGTILSTLAVIFMVVLFIFELSAFLTVEYTTAIHMDTNPNSQLRINFNITLLDLSCDYATVDLLDVIGTNRLNVSKNIEKVCRNFDASTRRCIAASMRRRVDASTRRRVDASTR